MEHGAPQAVPQVQCRRAIQASAYHALVRTSRHRCTRMPCMQQPHRHVTGFQIITQLKLKASGVSQPPLQHSRPTSKGP